MGNIDVKVKKTLKVTGGKTMVHLKNVKMLSHSRFFVNTCLYDGIHLIFIKIVTGTPVTIFLVCRV